MGLRLVKSDGIRQWKWFGDQERVDLITSTKIDQKDRDGDGNEISDRVSSILLGRPCLQAGTKGEV